MVVYDEFNSDIAVEVPYDGVSQIFNYMRSKMCDTWISAELYHEIKRAFNGEGWCTDAGIHSAVTQLLKDGVIQCKYVRDRMHTFFALAPKYRRGPVPDTVVGQPWMWNHPDLSYEGWALRFEPDDVD